LSAGTAGCWTTEVGLVNACLLRLALLSALGRGVSGGKAVIWEAVAFGLMRVSAFGCQQSWLPRRCAVRAAAPTAAATLRAAVDPGRGIASGWAATAPKHSPGCVHAAAGSGRSTCPACHAMLHVSARLPLTIVGALPQGSRLACSAVGTKRCGPRTCTTPTMNASTLHEQWLHAVPPSSRRFTTTCQSSAADKAPAILSPALGGSEAGGGAAEARASQQQVPSPAPLYSPLHYNIEEFCARVAPSEDERKYKQQIVDV
jgi:hypothetical protein